MREHDWFNSDLHYSSGSLHFVIFATLDEFAEHDVSVLLSINLDGSCLSK